MSKIGYEKIGDGVAIYKPTRSPFYWCRVRVDNHPQLKEIRRSLKTTDKYEAIFQAKTLQTETKVKLEHNIDLVTSKPFFVNLIKEAIKRLKDKKPFRKNYTEYIRILEKQMAPYFTENKFRIDEVDKFKIEDYFKAKELRSSTQIQITKTSFKHVFDEALRGKWINQSDVPEFLPIKRKEKKQKRDFFNETELANVLYSYSQWIDESMKEITKHNRFLLLAYSFYLIGAGCRPGQECLVTWSDLEIVEKQGVKILTCHVKKGKTSEGGGRTIVLDEDAFKALSLMAKYREGLDKVYSSESFGTPFFKLSVKYHSDIDIIEELPRLQKEAGDEYIFARYDGKIIDFVKTFEIYVNWLRKKELISKNKNHTLYSFRHTYITTHLLNKDGAEQWTAEQIATQCGNSLQMIWDFYLHLQTLDKVFNFKYYNELRKQNKDEEDTWKEIFKK